MYTLLLIIASVCFATGGLFMKYADGISRVAPAAAFLVLFIAGAILQSIAMRRADLGVAYILVLGLEAALAALFSAVILHERWSGERVIAVVLIVAGVALLRRA